MSQVVTGPWSAPARSTITTTSWLYVECKCILSVVSFSRIVAVGGAAVEVVGVVVVVVEGGSVL